MFKCAYLVIFPLVSGLPCVKLYLQHLNEVYIHITIYSNLFEYYTCQKWKLNFASIPKCFLFVGADGKWSFVEQTLPFRSQCIYCELQIIVESFFKKKKWFGCWNKLDEALCASIVVLLFLEKSPWIWFLFFRDLKLFL